jgi:MFS family permease
MIWFSELSPAQRAAIIGASGGWAVDGFDFVLYSLVMPTLIVTWGMTRAQAGLIATAALLTSSIGGWVAGILADSYGRVKILQLTIIWFSVCTFLSGFTNSFEQLAAIRALQGFGFGGEWAVGAVLVSEMMETKNRGKAVGIMQSGYAIGWAFATLAFTLFFAWLPENYAWRGLFFVGIFPAFLIAYLRARVAEPAIFLAAQTVERTAFRRNSFLEIFSRETMPTLALASVLAIGIQGAYYSVVTWLPTYLELVRGLSVISTGGYLFILIAGSFLGYLVGAVSTDRFGRRLTFMAFAVLSAVASYLYFAVKLPAIAVMLAGFPLGFTVSGMIGGLGAFLAELFPTRIRGSAQGFAYNSGRVVAASLPPLIGSFSARYSLESLMGVFACVFRRS